MCKNQKYLKNKIEVLEEVLKELLNVFIKLNKDNDNVIEFEFLYETLIDMMRDIEYEYKEGEDEKDN